MVLQKRNNRVLGVVAGVFLGIFAFGQQGFTVVENAFRDYTKARPTEKIFAHTDKDFYVAGEIIWCKLYVVNADDNKPTGLSKVAYVEVVDKDQRAVLQTKIALGQGTGSGSFYLPLSLNSGIYQLRAYTNWMKNFGAELYFEKRITIVNTSKASNIRAKATGAYDIQFFPEGGDLVQGIQSKVAFQVVDRAGKGVDCKGFVLSNGKDTITEFHPSKFGIGNFSFTPAAGNVYKAVVQLPDTNITKELPHPLEQGYVLSIRSVNSFQWRINIVTNIKSANVVYLFVHTRDSSRLAERLPLQNGVAQLLIDKNKLGEGISHVTLFNSEYVPVCERLVFRKPAQQLVIQTSINQQQFTSRKKISITVNTFDELKRSAPADMSVSVYRIDSLVKMQEEAIGSYFWLASELKGHIESPEYYFSDTARDKEEATDNLMLTHGWRKFTWQNVFQHSKADYNFLPEYKGHIITGKVLAKKTGQPSADVLAYLSVPGQHVQLYASRSDSAGNIKFYTKDFFGSTEVVLQTENHGDTNYVIQLNNPFSDKFSSSSLPSLDLSEKYKNLLSEYNVSEQVQNGFNAEKLRQFYSPAVDSAAFFGNADVQYMLDNYTRFSTMEEVLREYVNEVLVRRQRENFHFIMADGTNRIFLDDPFTLINGVPIFDPNKIIKYDPLKVKEIEIVKRKYFYGPLVMNGIVNFITYQPDASMLADLNLDILQYEGMQYQREFYSPVYDTQEQLTSRLPDFRNVLYWSPNIRTGADGKAEINFFTSDMKGRFVAILQGMDSEGRVGENSFFFDVK